MEAPLFFFFLNYLFLAAEDSVGQWSRSEVDGRFVALTAVCSTHGCVQLCEDAKAVRVSPMDAAVCLPARACAPVRSPGGVMCVHIGTIQRATQESHVERGN